MTPQTRPLALIALAAVLACTAAGFVHPGLLTSAAERLMQGARDAGLAGYAAFALMQALVAVSGVLPASLLGVAAGAAFGLPLGFCLSAVGTMVGAVLAFAFSRSVFRGAVLRQLARRPGLARFDALLARDGWRVVCLLRVSPIMPFAATSYALGLSAVAPAAYVIGTVASLPALLAYVYIGTLAGAGVSAWTTGAAPLRWALLSAGGVATLGLTLLVGRMARRALAEAAA